MPATPRRRPREILRALASLLVLAVLLAGVPLVLHALWHPLWPPLTAPGIWHALTTPDQGQLLIAVLGAAGWAAWTCFLLAVIVEIPAQVRRRPTINLPALGWAQRGAGTLIASIFLAFAAPVVALAAPGPAHAATIATASVTTTRPAAVHAQLEQTQGQNAHAASASATLNADTTSAAPGIPAGATYYTVEHTDNLWNIAAHCLGDGRKYPQIFDLNRGREQPDGRVLVEDDEIQPGWNLIMPAGALHCQVATATTTPDSAHAQREYTVETGDNLSSIAQAEDGTAADWPTIYHANQNEISNPNLIFPGQVIVIPAQPGPATDTASTSPAPSNPSAPSTPTTGQSPATGSGSTASTNTPSKQADNPDGAAGNSSTSAPTAPGTSSTPQTTAPSPVAPTTPTHTAPATTAHPTASPREGERNLYEILGIGGLAAAAALGALGLRRRRQQHARKTGEYIRMPGGEPIPTELELLLRASDDTAAGQWLDQILRTLAATAVTQHLDLPDLRLLSLGPDALYLQPATPTTPITPFTDSTDGWWVCPRNTELPTRELQLEVPSPYPALVTVGHDEQGRAIMIDLETVRAFALPGPAGLGALRALALELLGAKRVTVTLVGVGLELADVSLPASINLAVDLDDGIGKLETWIRFAGEQLEEIGATSVRAARLAQDADAPAAHILISAEEPSPTQAERLTALLQGAPSMCAAVITGTPITVNGPAWILPATGTAEPLEPTGIPVAAQFLTDPNYVQLIEHFRVSGQLESTPDPNWTAPSSGLDDEDPEEEAGDGCDLDPESVQYANFTEFAPADTAVTDDESVQELDWPGEDDPDYSSTATLGRDHTPGERQSGDLANLGTGPQILLLGSIELEGARGAVEDGRESVPLELAAFLVLEPHHRAGRRSRPLTAVEVTAALWPGGTSTENRNNVTSRLRAWLGVNAISAPYFPPVHRGYRLHEEVCCDLIQFNSFYTQGIKAYKQGRTRDAAGFLEAALGLVRGRPFADAPPNRYGWAEDILQQTLSEIAGAAEILAKIRVAEDDWPGAARAATLGMVTGIATFEELFRIRFEAAYRARDTTEMDRLAATLAAQLDEIGLPMSKSTRMLMYELMERHPAHS